MNAVASEPSPASEPRYLRLGDRILDREARTLSEPGGKTRPIQHRSFLVLARLVAGRGGVVTKKELLDSGWSDVAVSENSLSQAISQLRRLLGDSTGTPGVIVTVHGVGYRLGVPAEPHDAAPAGAPRTRGRRLVPVLTLALVAALAGYLALRARHSTAGGRLAAAVSPSGDAVAYFRSESPGLALYVESSDGFGPRRLREMPRPESLALTWAPDGVRLAYNTTLADDPFYSLETLRITDGDQLFLKFAKSAAEHDTASVPPDLDRPVRVVQVEERALGRDTAHVVALSDSDRLVVYFEHGLVTALSWARAPVPD